MATYQDQIKTAFDTYTSAGKTPQQIYDEMKKKLSTNTVALSTLDDYYKTINPSSATGMKTDTPSSLIATKTTPPIKGQTSTQTDSQTPAGARTMGAGSTSYQDQIKTAFDKYVSSGKTPQEVYDAMRKKLTGNQSATSALINYFNQYGVKKTTPEQRASIDTTFSNEATKMAGISGLDKDTQGAVQNQMNVINKEYEDKIKAQQEYAKGIMDAYNQNKAEFDAKYKDMRDTVGKMESELLDNYGQLKKAVAENYTSGMETYARQAAAAQAGISGTLSKSGISGSALANALAEAQYDPKRLGAIQSLKDKQITDLTNLQTNYDNWYNKILANKATLTTAEKQLADTVLARKDQLDTELQNLKNTNLTDVYAPLKDILGKKTTALSEGEIVDEQREKNLRDYLTATPARKKDILLYQLRNAGVEMGYIDEALLNEAIQKSSMPDAITFLTAKSKTKADEVAKAATTGTTSFTNPSSTQFSVAGGTEDTTSPKVTMSDLIAAVDKQINVNKLNPADVKKRLLDSGVDPKLVQKINWGKYGKGTTQTKQDSTVIENNKKNIPSGLSELNAGIKAGFVGWTADKAKSLITKLGTKAIPDSLKASIPKLFARANNVLNDKMLEDKLIKIGEQALAQSKNATEMLMKGEELIKNAAQTGLKKAGITNAERTILTKLSQFGTKALPGIMKAGTLGARILGSLPFGVVAGVLTPQDWAKEYTQYNDDIKNMKSQGVPIESIKTWLHSEAGGAGNIPDAELTSYIQQL